MHLLPLFMSLASLPSLNGTWYGYCIIEISNKQVCSEIAENTGNFASYCDSFARDHGAFLWITRFSTDLKKLQDSMKVYCDVQPGDEGLGAEEDGF